MLATKMYEKSYNNLQKTGLKSTPQLASILVPTWLHFGRVWGAKLEPNWHQIALKVDPKSNTKNDHLLDRPKIHFLRILAPTCPPRGGWKCLSFLYISALGALLGPSWAQDRPKPLQKASWDRSSRILTPNLMDFGRIWEPILVDFVLLWCQQLNQQTNQPTKQPSKQATKQPTKQATKQPSNHPSEQPNNQTT